MKLILSSFSRSFLCESEATAANCFFCSESKATVTSTFIGEEINADLVSFQWVPKHRLIEDKASGGCHGF